MARTAQTIAIEVFKVETENRTAIRPSHNDFFLLLFFGFFFRNMTPT
jgi:hypothetical protein